MVPSIEINSLGVQSIQDRQVTIHEIETVRSSLGLRKIIFDLGLGGSTLAKLWVLQKVYNPFDKA